VLIGGPGQHPSRPFHGGDRVACEPSARPIGQPRSGGTSRLRNALTKLSPEHREIIDLVYYHEKAVDDAADILSIPRATVKTRLFYARKKLAELVQGA
jgi:DNA-directed RNA polymerase specialized sigma24 family protein